MKKQKILILEPTGRLADLLQNHYPDDSPHAFVTVKHETRQWRKQVKAHRPVIILVDLPKAWEQAKKRLDAIRKAAPDVGLIALLPANGSDWAFWALKCGVDGLLRQVDKPEEIARAIATVLAEGTYWCADSRLALLPAFKDRPVLQPDERVSQWEAEALWLYLDHSVSEIADKLHLTVSAVKWRLQSARDKLGVRRTTSAIPYLFERDDHEQPKRE